MTRRFHWLRISMLFTCIAVTTQVHAVEAMQPDAGNPPIVVPDTYWKDNFLLKWEPPKYPGEAKADGISGHLTLEFDVNRNGKLENIVVVDSVPPGVFDYSVMKVAHNITVVPYRVSSCFVPLPKTRLTFRFKSENGKATVAFDRPAPLSDPASRPSAPNKSENANSTPAASATGSPPTPNKPLKINQVTPLEGPRVRSVGWVVAMITFGTNGKVDKISIPFAAPDDIFADEVSAKVKTWTASTYDGDLPQKPTIVCAPFDFRMNKD